MNLVDDIMFSSCTTIIHYLTPGCHLVGCRVIGSATTIVFSSGLQQRPKVK